MPRAADELRIVRDDPNEELLVELLELGIAMAGSGGSATEGGM